MNPHDRSWIDLQNENDDSAAWDAYIVMVSAIILIWLLTGGAA